MTHRDEQRALLLDVLTLRYTIRVAAMHREWESLYRGTTNHAAIIAGPVTWLAATDDDRR